jgi:PTS system mannose-specific IIA component
MTGIVIVTHNQLGSALIEAAEFIMGEKLEAITAISVDINSDPDNIGPQISQAIKEVDQQNGILILTDMFGGTPSNISYSFLQEGAIEVLSGVNLPILVKAISLRKSGNLSENAQKLAEYGKRSISLASDILQGKKRS